jgi:NAD(P)-dependent dehydrogenase (short-subunit alcohol dehydrogenase family)
MSRQVVVTGASRGIGRETAARFAQLGDDVLAVARSAGPLAELAAAHPERVRTAVCDLTDEAAVVALLGPLARIDVLVNNAGIGESAPLTGTTLEAWQRQFAVNATAAFLCTREVIGGMRERDEGRVVTVASTAGVAGAPYTAAYTASKHAAVGLMRATAAELAGTRVTANAVCPAFVDTPMTRETVDRIVQRTGRGRGESLQALTGMSPLGRLLAPAEVADAILWLASSQAAAINGQTLILDGGGIQL